MLAVRVKKLVFAAKRKVQSYTIPSPALSPVRPGKITDTNLRTQILIDVPFCFPLAVVSGYPRKSGKTNRIVYLGDIHRGGSLVSAR